MTDNLFGTPLFTDIKTYVKHPRVDVPEYVLAELRKAQANGKYVYWALPDPDKFEEMANILRSGGDLLEQASVLVRGGIFEKVKGRPDEFLAVDDLKNATHIRATVAKRRGYARKTTDTE